MNPERASINQGKSILDWMRDFQKVADGQATLAEIGYNEGTDQIIFGGLLSINAQSRRFIRQEKHRQSSEIESPDEESTNEGPKPKKNRISYKQLKL